ncbi:MAG TPA: hypothetical protein VK890_11365 [Bacteroidia bacterium]|jgi:hypothetical protein|nr:hypothetical protein [Bacteroidia bacterium]
MKKQQNMLCLETRLSEDFLNDNVYGIRLIDTYKLGRALSDINLDVFQFNSLPIFSRNLGDVVKDEVNIFDVNIYFQFPLINDVKLIFSSTSEKTIDMVRKHIHVVPLQYHTTKVKPFIKFIPIRSRALSLV